MCAVSQTCRFIKLTIINFQVSIERVQRVIHIASCSSTGLLRVRGEEERLRMRLGDALSIDGANQALKCKTLGFVTKLKQSHTKAHDFIHVYYYLCLASYPGPSVHTEGPLEHTLRCQHASMLIFSEICAYLGCDQAGRSYSYTAIWLSNKQLVTARSSNRFYS